MTPAEHYMEAERLLAEGEKAVRMISILNNDRSHYPYHHQQHARHTHSMDEHGKKAMGCWAQAQVHATLALAQEGLNG